MNEKRGELWQVKGAGKWFPGTKDELLNVSKVSATLSHMR